MRDIDLIIEKVKQKLPEVKVDQLRKINPGDDDGIWYFALPNIKPEMQIESGYGNCPFMVETNEQSSYDAGTANTLNEAVEMIVEYLESKKKK